MSRDVVTVKTVDAHAGGGALRLIVEGFPSVRGKSLVQRRAWAERHCQSILSPLLREPRGHMGLTVAILTAPVSEAAVAGVLLFGGEHPPAISGHGLIAMTTIALERGLLVLPDASRFVVDTLAGPVALRPRAAAPGRAREDQRVVEVSYRPPPVFVARAALPVNVDGRHARVDVAWASGWYAIVDREALGVPPESGFPDSLRRAARGLVDAIEPGLRNEPTPSGAAAPVEGVVFTGPPGRADADLRSLTVYADGTLDRSPSGGGTAAVLAVLDAMGVLHGERPLSHEGPAGLTFRARVAERTMVGEHAAIVAEIAGEAWITGEHTFLLDPEDPLAQGFLL